MRKKIKVGETYEFNFVGVTERYYAVFRWDGNYFIRIKNNEAGNTNILSSKKLDKAGFKYLMVCFYVGQYEYLGITE